MTVLYNLRQLESLLGASTSFLWPLVVSMLNVHTVDDDTIFGKRG